MDEDSQIKTLKYNINSSKLSNDINSQYIYLCELASIFKSKSDYKNAIRYYLSASSLIEKNLKLNYKKSLENKLLFPYKLIGVCYQNLYNEKDWYLRALTFHNKHLTLAKKQNLTEDFIMLVSLYENNEMDKFWNYIT